MEFKSILVPFLDEQSARQAFASAAHIARESKGHLSCVHIRQRPVPATTIVYPLGGVFTEYTESYQEAENKLVNDLNQLFTMLCNEGNVGVGSLSEHSNERGITASWRDVEGDLLSVVPRLAMACDFAVLSGAGDDTSRVARKLAEELLFQSGRPLLLTPLAGLKESPKKIVVAWNGRPEAARAVGSGLGLLREAEAVKVLTVRKAEPAGVHTDDITAYLRLHGVEAAQTEVELAEGEDETKKLDEEISEFGADFLIMGAYSHNRWRETILGGFTRHILKYAKISVFMSR